MLKSRVAASVLLAVATVFWDAADAAEFIARTTTVTEMKAVFGQVASRNVVPSRARIGGTVREIRVSEGSEVKEGDVIAVIVDDKIALELQAADSKINALKSQLENARTELERAQQLLARGVTAQSRLDVAKMALDVVLNQVAAAEAEKAVIKQRAREGDTLAPATGRVLTVPVTPGSVILPGEEVARIATGHYYLRLSLPERHAAEIVEGGTVVVGTRGLAQPPMESRSEPKAAAREGHIAKVYPEISNGRVIADVEVAEIGDYFVNERTLVSIPVGKRSVLAVPPEAVKTLHGVDYVRVATSDGEMDVAVILGGQFEDKGERRIEILTGLRDGDRIILP
ncbi:efflux RND transporter periplasmic adaptor subunit [Sinorhizobium alkalisoli]|uniref:Efflux transporter periplasmic adaptor subunit n=1 Tax=Sinorhizobium alkalisoli TaxID=1752398 RepID=A0A1E3V495_9HYPH|nr:efflux RND transporter periplasmic adaptor subunit [Sinorhizobium alkalisoli]MCG5481140.1 efflux RND transporter periplasmic adaptor subunit [Sinorhizobium alkalisoli]ODR88389.1 efflux transporter periplasmic adaptor subunit [Sinorhizobium alkalisoli]